MKQIVFVFALLFSVLGFSQDSIQVTTQKELIKLNFGTTFKFNEVEVQFVKVLSDSRCPKNVDCIWAGEAVVLVDIIIEGKLLKQQKLSFSPSSQLQNKFANIFKSTDFNITGLNMLPYPENGSKIKASDYYLHLEISY